MVAPGKTEDVNEWCNPKQRAAAPREVAGALLDASFWGGPQGQSCHRDRN